MKRMLIAFPFPLRLAAGPPSCEAGPAAVSHGESVRGAALGFLESLAEFYALLAELVRARACQVLALRPRQLDERLWTFAREVSTPWRGAAHRRIARSDDSPAGSRCLTRCSRRPPAGAARWRAKAIRRSSTTSAPSTRSFPRGNCQIPGLSDVTQPRKPA